MAKRKDTYNENMDNSPINSDDNENDVTQASETNVTEASNHSEKEVQDAESNEETTLEPTEQSKSDESVTPSAQKKKLNLYKIIRIACMFGFVIFSLLFINDVFIQPYRLNQANQKAKSLYKVSTPTPAVVQDDLTPTPVVTLAPNVTVTPTPDPNRDSLGRLIQFKDVLEANEDTKGWISIPDTNIDYPVLQNNEDPDYYLTHSFEKEKVKGGSLYLERKSSVETNTKNMLIYGHNMKSTDNMFHYLEHMKKLDYFKDRAVFNFDTIYQTGQWKIISVFITPGSDKKESFFDFTRASFKDSSDFMNFVYQLRIRSMFNLDMVDINENDQILTLCTCSYEINDYREVIVARKVREGEDPTIDSDSIKKNSNALYPKIYNDNYGKEAAVYPATFEDALNQGIINWYKAPDQEE